jgi:tubulin beta
VHGRRYVPHAILMDLDPDSRNSVQLGPLGQIFRAYNFVSGQGCAGGNYTTLLVLSSSTL